MSQPEFNQDEGFLDEPLLHPDDLEPHLVHLVAVDDSLDELSKWELLEHFSTFARYAERHRTQEIFTVATFSYALKIGYGEQLDQSVTINTKPKAVTLPLAEWYVDNVVRPIANYMQRYSFISLLHVTFCTDN